MVRYKALAVATKYWRPGENYVEEIIKGVRGKISDGDFIVISEKAISAATNNIVDENLIVPSISAKLIAKYWMRIVWGYFAGVLCHFQEKSLRYLRRYPSIAGNRHKQVALERAGVLQALLFGSEGGIDGSNLAYACVSLPLSNAYDLAEEVRKRIQVTLGKSVFVMIVDSDKTYRFRNFFFTPRPNPIQGIHSFGGFFSYILGSMFKLTKYPTPIALSGCKVCVNEALRIAKLADHVRGFGSGKTVWDMAEKFKVNLTDVSWEMLQTVKHKPIVIVRNSRR